MKRIVLLISFFLSYNAISAQFFEIGVYTEPQVTWISSDESRIISEGSNLNLNTGIEFNMFFMPNYAFTLGIGMNNQGGKLAYADSISFVQNNGILEVPGPATLKHKLQYVSLPLGLKLKTEEMGYMTFYIHGGLIPMFSLGATTNSELLNLNKENIAEEIRLFNLNYFFEGGVEYRLAGNTALICGLKWSGGLTDVTENDYANNNLNSLGLHIGILF